VTAHKVDVLVIGAGIQGCAVARELARHGRTVVVLDPGEPGGESSGVAAGILGPHLDLTADGAFLELCLHGGDRWPDWAAAIEEESGMAVEYVRCGAARVALSDAYAHELRSHVPIMQARGQNVGWFSAEALREREPGLPEGVKGGIAVESEARVDTVRLMRALVTAARRAGVRFVREGARQVDVLPGAHWGPGEGEGNPFIGAPRLRIHGDLERWEARHVILAAGAWSGAVPGAPVPTPGVRPLRGQAVVLDCGLPPIRSILFSHRGYVVPRDDGSVYCGSTVERAGFDRSVTAAGLRSILDASLELVPALGNAPVRETFAGLRPHTEDFLPVLGRGSLPGLWHQWGHFRVGILTAPVSAVILAELILGGRPPLDPSPYSVNRFLS
jgi:glycine oxidase